jgi:hypothetical protein
MIVIGIVKAMVHPSHADSTRAIAAMLPLAAYTEPAKISNMMNCIARLGWMRDHASTKTTATLTAITRRSMRIAALNDRLSGMPIVDFRYY